MVIFVGACKRSIKQAEWEAPFTFDSAILLADDPEEAEPENVIFYSNGQQTNERRNRLSSQSAELWQTYRLLRN